MNSVLCPNCGFTVGEQIGGKLGLGFAGLLLGSRVDPMAAAVFGLLGMVVGHYYIDAVSRTCPQCGMVFNIAAALL